jgi:hypothetical protein
MSTRATCVLTVVSLTTSSAAISARAARMDVLDALAYE